LALLDEIGKRRGGLQKGGKTNVQKVAGIILNDLRTGKIGRITFELPQDLECHEEKVER
jgi:ribosome biogenesis GTPase A